MVLLVSLLISCSAQALEPTAQPLGATASVRGVTISTPTYGPEWGSPEMGSTLDLLAQTGVNWIAYHPYARIQADGLVVAEGTPPAWMISPIEMAHERGLKVMVKPHLAHWGSGFSWRGAIVFHAPAERMRFWTSYRAWITQLAEACNQADTFVVGTELDKMDSEQQWRGLIAQVRSIFPGQLTYAANWDAYEQVPFWDALDYVGIQAYFPIIQAGEAPTELAVSQGWERVMGHLRTYSQAQGKQVLFTELGYDASPQALVRPWQSGRGAEALQLQALEAALTAVEEEPSVAGLFLWKWFPGELQRGDFRLSSPQVQGLLRSLWAVEQAPAPAPPP